MKYKNCFAKRLSRNQEEIKLYIQIGRKYNIPYDILKIIFREKYRCNLNYHQNIIIFTCLEYNSWPEEFLKKCYEEQLFNYRIPDNRGIEWAIKQIECEPGDWCSKERMARYNTLLQIKILGEEHYLLKNIKYLLGHELSVPWIYLSKQFLFANELYCAFSNLMSYFHIFNSVP